MVNVEQIIGVMGDPSEWDKQCHAASIYLVRSGILPKNARVARGTHSDVGGQHSWVVLGDPYDDYATIIDPTLWSYDDSIFPGEPVVGDRKTLGNKHIPKGYGHFMNYGPPPPPRLEIIDLGIDWSSDAKFLFDVIGHPLDIMGWSHIAHMPVGGWAAKEIITAMYEDDRTRALIPIDIVGMVTDLNPKNLYW